MKNYRRLHPHTVAFVVRITVHGYYVLSQHATYATTMEALKKALQGGAAVVRRRKDGARFSYTELIANNQLLA